MTDVEEILDTMYKAMVKIDQKRLGCDLIDYVAEYADQYDIDHATQQRMKGYD